MQRMTWLRMLRAKTKGCPGCGALEWLPGDFDPLAILASPNSPNGHPELPYGLDGTAVLPATCRYCGYVALYSVQHFQNGDPWE